METRFALPATFAAALHVFALFGLPTSSKRPDAPPPKPVEPGVERIVTYLDPEPPEIEVRDWTESAPKGNPDALRPTLDDPVSIVPDSQDFFRQEVEVQRELPPHMVSKLVPGIYGNPNTDGDRPIGPSVFSLDQLDNAPRTRSQSAPVYPPSAKSMGLSGRATVEFEVDENGRVRNARVIHASHSIFEEASLNAVSRWRFEPGRRQGKPVRFRMVVPIEFNLNE